MVGSSRDTGAAGTRTDGVGGEGVGADVSDVIVCDVGVVGVTVGVDVDAGVGVAVDVDAEAGVLDVRDGDDGDGDGHVEEALSDGAGGGMRAFAGTRKGIPCRPSMFPEHGCEVERLFTTHRHLFCGVLGVGEPIRR